MESRQLSPHTISDYTVSFRKFQQFFKTDPPFSKISAEEVEQFLSRLGSVAEGQLNGAAPRPAKPLSKKSLLNVHTALSALWSYAVAKEITKRHILREVRPPKPETRAIVPFTEHDVKAVLAACDHSQPYGRPGKRTAENRRPTARRDKAIIKLLVDTGIRASELCDLRFLDVDFKNQRIVVFGKGSKERVLPMSARVKSALSEYIEFERPGPLPAADAAEPLFLTHEGNPFNRDALLDLLNSLGRRAGVPDCHPHRFRHTFAVEYLRNRANTLALRELLGHVSNETLEIYVKLAEVDLANIHKYASPAERWRL